MLAVAALVLPTYMSKAAAAAATTVSAPPKRETSSPIPETIGEMTSTTPVKAVPNPAANSCIAGIPSSRAMAILCKAGVIASLIGSPNLATTRLIFSNKVPQLPAVVLESWEDRLKYCPPSSVMRRRAAAYWSAETAPFFTIACTASVEVPMTAASS